jgi:hypothetical protein
MAEQIDINIKISSNLETTANKAVKGIDKVKDAAAEATEGSKELGEASQGAIRLIDVAFGGIGSKLLRVKDGLTSLKTGFDSSFKAGIAGAGTLQKALIATGIGALVVALGLIVAYWDDITGLITGVSSEQTKLLEKTKNTAKAQQDALDALTLQENALRLAGKSEKEIRDLKVQQTNETIASLEAQLLVQEQIKQSQIDSAKRNKQILDDIIKTVAVPLTMLLQTIDNVGIALGKDFGLTKSFKATRDSFASGLGDMIFDQSDEIKAEGEAAIKETKDQLAKLKSARDGVILQDRKEKADAAKIANEKAAKDAETLAAKEKEAQAAITALNKETLDLIAANQEAAFKDEIERENARFANLQAKLTREREEQVKAAEGNPVLIAAVNAKYDALEVQAAQTHATTIEGINKAKDDKLLAQNQQAADINRNLIANEQMRELANLQAAFDAQYAAAEGNAELRLALQNKFNADVAKVNDDAAKKTLDKEKQRKQALQDFIIDSALQTLSVLKELNGIFDKDNEEAARKSFNRNKALSIAETLITTYASAAKAYASQLALGDLSSPLRGAIAAGIAVAGGLARVAAISATKFDGGGTQSTSPSASGAVGSGGGSVPAPQFNIVGQSGTNQLAQSIGGQFNQPIRAYVVGGDVTTSQQLQRQRVRTATFG